MEIFIGSSSESKSVMRQVAIWVEEKGFTPLPWDRLDLFVAGDTTFQSIIDITKRPNIGGAIFIFGEDDKVWHRGADTGQPRDNVLIEYGIFVGALGPKKAIICRSGKPKIATDVLGVNYIDINPTNIYSAQRRVDHWIDKL